MPVHCPCSDSVAAPAGHKPVSLCHHPALWDALEYLKWQQTDESHPGCCLLKEPRCNVYFCHVVFLQILLSTVIMASVFTFMD